MKKILLAGLLLFPVLITNAQDDFRKFRFGLKASPNVGWFKPDTKGFESEGAKINFSYGLMTEFGLGNNYSLATGLEVTTLGGKLSFPDSTFYYVDDIVDTANRFILMERTYKVQYIDLPILLKMKTNEIGYLTYFGQFGFNFGFRTKATADDYGRFPSTAKEAELEDNNINKDANLMRIGLNIGAGAEYNLSGKTSLLFSVNYNNGFTNALKKNSSSLKNAAGAELAQKALSKYIALNVGILF